MPPECPTCGTYWKTGEPDCDCNGRNPQEVIRALRAEVEEAREEVKEVKDWANANNKRDECPHCDRMLYPWEECDCEKKG